MGYIKGALVLVALIVICSFGISFWMMNRDKIVKKETEPVNELLGIEHEEKHTSEILSDGFKDMGELVTYQYYYTQTDTQEDVAKFKGFKIPITKNKYIISYDGTIEAGINFSDILVEEDEGTGTITITIPDAIITSNEVDTSSFEALDEDNNIFNPIKVSDVNNSIDSIKSNALEKAKSKGILEKAKANARTLIENFVESIVDTKETSIVYK